MVAVATTMEPVAGPAIQEKNNKKKHTRVLKHGDSDSLQASVVFLQDGTACLASYDTMAQVGICNSSMLPKNAKIVTQNDGTVVEGVGGKLTPAGTLYSIEMSMRLGSDPVTMMFRVAPLSTKGLHFLWDLKQIRETLGGTIDTTRSYMRAELIGQVIQTEPICVLYARTKLPPMKVVGACGGMATDLLAILEMGYSVSEYVLIERDEMATNLVKTLYTGTGVKITVHKELEAVHGVDIGYAHLGIFTPTCGPWSRLKTRPKGFDDPESSAFVQCGRLRRELLEINPALMTVFETNQPHEALIGDVPRQVALAGSPFILINASKVKSPSHRFRRFSLWNIPFKVTPGDLASGDPAHYIRPGWRPEQVPVPCLVSAPNTKRPVILMEDRTGHLRCAWPSELDALNGLPAGYSHAYEKIVHGTLGRTHDEHRKRLTGQCLNQFHTRIVFRFLGPTITSLKIVKHIKSTTAESDPLKLELYLRGLTYEEKKKWIASKYVGWTRPVLQINISNDQIPYKCKHIPEVKATLEKSVDKKMADNKAKGRMIELNAPDQSHWLSPMFFKSKGKKDLDGDEAIRQLCDCVVVNSYAVIEPWWREHVVKIEDFKAEFAEDSTVFCIRDLCDAFEQISLHVDSRRYVVFIYKHRGRVKYLMATVAIQGLALSAFFYPIWWIMINYQAFGYAFLMWWASYVDDNCIKGRDLDQAEGRNEIFEAFCEVNKIDISPKTPKRFAPEVTAAGFAVSAKGLRAPDIVVEALNMRLDVAVGGVRQARNLRGVIESARTAFHMAPGQHRIYAELMAPLHEAIATADREKKWPKQLWQDTCLPSLAELRTFIKSVPRAHIHPDSLITSECCVIYLGDSSDVAAGVGLYRVMIPDARDVKVPEDLKDEAISTLVMSFARGHEPGKVDWLTYQNETECLVEALEKSGKRITQALAKFDLTDGICKVGAYTDSSTARAIACGLNDPASRPEFHTAMARKWLNWSQRVYFTRGWRAHYGHCEGLFNEFADWLSHVGHLLKAEGDRNRSQTVKNVNETHVTKPGGQYTLLNKQLKIRKFDVPEGWNLNGSTLNLTPTQWDKVAIAQSEDQTTVFHKVSVSDMYHVLCDTTLSAKVNQLIKDRINSWRTKLFAVRVNGSSLPVLLVPQSMSRSEAQAFKGLGIDEKLEGETEPRKLVTLAPYGLVGVTVSCIPPLDGKPLDVSFRDDLLNLFHEWDGHLTASQMYARMSAVVWWPTMASDITEWVKYCSLCMSKLKAKRRAGMGIVIRKRFKHITGDHCILPGWLQELTGYLAVLVLLDLGSGDIEMIPCKSMTPEETCAHIFNWWIRTRGFFVTFGSDHGSAFVASVMAIFWKLLGIQVHKLSAIADSRGMASVEAKNRLVREMEAEVSHNGLINNASDLEMCITRYVIKHTQVRSTGGSTVFERKYGQPALGIGDLLTVASDVGDELEDLDDDSAEFINRVASVTASMMDDYNTERMVRCRDNAYSRDSEVAGTRGYEQDFEVGQILSLKGQKVTVVDLEGFDGRNHLIATIQEEGDPTTRRVRCEDLRECCWARPQWRPIGEMKPAIGDFVLFTTDSDGFNRGGTVMEFVDKSIVIHELCSNDNRSRWIPVWTKQGAKDKIVQKCPVGYDRLLYTVSPTDILLVGKIKGMVLSDDTKRRAKANGMDWALQTKTKPAGSAAEAEN